MRLLNALFLLSLLLVVGLSSTVAQPSDSSVIEQCSALLPADRPMPTGADAPTITFTSPADGDVIYGDQAIVSIQTDNFDLNVEGRHWHLWVDGTLMGMVYQDSAIIDLTPGTHVLCASIGNTDHADLGIPAGLTLTVQQPVAGTPTAAFNVSPEVGRVIPEPDITPTQILLIAGLGLVAAIGGWWLGSRLPKRRK
jgi:hypothetical protein